MTSRSGHRHLELRAALRRRRRGRRRGRRARGARLLGAVGRPTSAATCSAPSPPCSARRRTDDRGHGHPQHLDAHARGDRRAARRAERRARRAASSSASASATPTHRPRRGGRQYQRPLAQMAAFLDGLDAADAAVPVDDRVLAALGPKMLDLARDTHRRHPPVPRDARAHARSPARPARRRRASSPPSRASCSRPIRTGPGRSPATPPRDVPRAPNYTNNWRRLGFTDDDLADGGSDRLVDALVVVGRRGRRIAARVQEHRDAGAEPRLRAGAHRRLHAASRATSGARLAPALT